MAHIGQRTGACRDLVGKSEGQTPLGRPRRRWQDNVYMDLQRRRIVGRGLDLSGSGYGKQASTAGPIKFEEVLD